MKLPIEKASSAVMVILGPTSHYRLSCLEGAVLIHDTRDAGPEWLDARVPEFRMPRTSLGLADSALWMQVELLLNPHQGGFAGDIPGDDPNNQIGPFDIRGATVRALLCHLVGSSRGATWIAGTVEQSFGTSWSNRLWTMIPCDRNPH